MKSKGFLPDKTLYNSLILIVFALFIMLAGCRDRGDSEIPRQIFQNPPESAKPWIFWYWMNASVTKEAITADLEAMKENGIGGAYLMPIRGPADPPLLEPPVVQLTSLWWEMVLHALNEAKRLNLKIAMHASDGFALAGGPWITPELSMQKVVWTQTYVEGGKTLDILLDQPETNEGYYQDIVIFAYPAEKENSQTTFSTIPIVTSSIPGENPQYLVKKDNRKAFRSSEPCSIEYRFDKPFTCRSIIIRANGSNYQANRLIVRCSNDGIHFRTVCRLEPPRHGWQDEGNVTHAIEPTTASFFRFLYDTTGSEPGAEDLDGAKWKPSLKITGIELSEVPKIHQFEGKTGAVWRISSRTKHEEVADSLCVQPEDFLNISEKVDENGHLSWNVPEGYWSILRIGHTSTGKTNYTGGGGLGLECDKFNTEAVKLQFDNWFGAVVQNAGDELVERALKIFHVDSWECGSQNWSPVFREEFRQRRGYDLMDYLPVMAGIPVVSADVSERFLYDIRQTISELVADNFYGTLKELAYEHGCEFSGENIAPVFTSDGILIFDNLDIPMGEFWLRSPTHDKPNDMLDAISGAHIYGKQIIQAEAFTQLRMAWDEHPAMLKALGDMNFAMGANCFVIHVFTHNPWTDRQPGMTLDGVGLYFQRDQTWWDPGRVWVEYLQRCQTLLQRGRPVVDIAVFTGEEIPRRAVLPDRLVSSLPGIFGEALVVSEKQRLANKGIPLREMPEGVIHTANMTDPADWIDPLNGYAYDSFNPDVLLNLAKVKNGDIVLPGGSSYELLVIPGTRAMAPNGEIMSCEVAGRVLELVEDGATVLFVERPLKTPGLHQYEVHDKQLDDIVSRLFDGNTLNRSGEQYESMAIYQVGKGKIIHGPYTYHSFDILGIKCDFMAFEKSGEKADGIAWTHRKDNFIDIYFISNQKQTEREIEISVRSHGKVPELYDPITGEIHEATEWMIEDERTVIPIKLFPNGSMFIVLSKKTKEEGLNNGPNWLESETIMLLNGPWSITFDQEHGGLLSPVFIEQLRSWHLFDDPDICNYSGTATYQYTFQWESINHGAERYLISLGKVCNIAEVYLNDESCGVAWTWPYQVDITQSLREGENQLTIEISNTWANRLIGDHALPPEDRITWTAAPFNLEGKPLLESGLLGPVSIISVGKK